MRYMNWETDLRHFHSCKSSAQHIDASPKEQVWLQDIPQMEDSATFDVILGSDVLYEVCSAAQDLFIHIHQSASASSSTHMGSVHSLLALRL